MRPANISECSTPIIFGNKLSRRRGFRGIFRSKRLISLRQPMVLECKLKQSGKSLFDGRAGPQLFGRLHDSAKGLFDKFQTEYWPNYETEGGKKRVSHVS